MAARKPDTKRRKLKLNKSEEETGKRSTVACKLLLNVSQRLRDMESLGYKTMVAPKALNVFKVMKEKATDPTPGAWRTCL